MLDDIVRRMAPSDWRRYREVRLRALQDDPDAFGTLYADVVDNPDEFWRARLSNLSADHDLPLFAEMGGAVAGLAWGRIERSDRHRAYLFQMWVAPEHRGHGVGRALVDAVAAWAASRGARSLELTVTCGNTAAIRLYESAGFQAIGIPEPMRPDSELLEQSMKRVLAQNAP
jgi:ribosomal protein S18 acetylase RimI-like enzyme